MTSLPLPSWLIWFEDQQAIPEVQSVTASVPDRAPRYLCSACQHVICNQAARTTFGECFEHTFFNPHGVLFRIGCFSPAPGVAVHGTPSNEFSWFPSYHWQVAMCRKCDQHLGWYFTGSGSPFFGLILPRLVFAAT